jgi:hypothetical protein
MLKKTEPRIQLLDQPAPEQLLTATYPDDALGRIEPMLYLTAAMTVLRQGEPCRHPKPRLRRHASRSPTGD